MYLIRQGYRMLESKENEIQDRLRLLEKRIQAIEELLKKEKDLFLDEYFFKFVQFFLFHLLFLLYTESDNLHTYCSTKKRAMGA